MDVNLSRMMTAAADGDSGLLSLLILLAILILCAKLAGAAAVSLRQPAVFGELLVGLLLGPSLLDIFHLPVIGDPSGVTYHVILQLGQLGVIFLMFSAGLEAEIAELRQTGRAAMGAGILGVAAPILLSAVFLFAFPGDWRMPVLIGIVLAATSVSISVQTLIELGKLRTREGMTLLSAAVVDDILVILIMSVFFGVASGGGESVALTIVRMLLTLAVTAAAGYYLLPILANAASRLPVSQGLFALVIAAALIFSWSAEYLGGMAAITGAFLAGAGLARTRWREEIRRPLDAMNYAFFVPLFLVGVGLQADLHNLDLGGLGLALALLLVAVLSKVIGCSLGVRFGGMRGAEALRVGVGMISRGEVGLIVAGAGRTLGLLDVRVFTLLTLTILATTLITPPLLRWSFAASGKGGSHDENDPLRAG
jgi:Kef-type K+ transport system membrane component KefB